MKTIYLITNNKGKLLEIKKFLENDKTVKIKVKQLNLDLNEIQETDPKKIIKHKVLEALKHHKRAFILEDTSLYINGLNNLPGPLIKWFLKELGNNGLYKLAAKMGNKKAKAVTIFACVKNKKEILYFKGETEGEITKPKGKNDFGWGPIFKPDKATRTFGEMQREEKEKYSMRVKALKKLKKFLDKN